MEPADPAIIASVRAGHPDWSLLREQYRPLMQREAHRLLNASAYMGDESILGESAEDVVEQVLEELYETGIPQDIRSLPSFLRKCARNRTKDLLGRAQYDQPLPDPETNGLAWGTSAGVLRRTPRTRRTTTSPS
jgi:DNA-directed RNA polymerase specialized sigma24 family protein